jgi:hypothetical protein
MDIYCIDKNEISYPSFPLARGWGYCFYFLVFLSCIYGRNLVGSHIAMNYSNNLYMDTVMNIFIMDFVVTFPIWRFTSYLLW